MNSARMTDKPPREAKARRGQDVLSGPQRKFCEGIAKGMTGEAAWMAAYPKASKAAARARASEALTKSNIVAVIESLRQRADVLKGGAVLTLAEKREFLARIVRMKGDEIDLDKDGDLVNGVRLKEQGRELILPDKLAAIKIDNDLSGDGAEADQGNALVDLVSWIRNGANVTPKAAS
jgi:hypothetical protein